MRLLSKLIIILIVISFGTVSNPNLSLAQEDSSEKAKVTVHKPEGVILTEKKPDKSRGWLWAIIGAIAIVGGVVAATGGSSSSGGDDGSSTPGEYEFTW